MEKSKSSINLNIKHRQNPLASTDYKCLKCVHVNTWTNKDKVNNICSLRHFCFPLRCIWSFRCSGTFRSLCWELATDVSEQPFGPILKGEETVWPWQHKNTYIHTHVTESHVSHVPRLHTIFCDKPQSSGCGLFFCSTILLTARIRVRRNTNGRTTVRGHRRETFRPTATK